MTPERWEELQQRFHEALDLPEDERSAWLDALQAADAELALDVRSLLDAEARGPMSRQLDTPSGGARAGVVGPYRLVRKLGEGGMGAVYLAEREVAGFRQRVALKLLRPGFLDPRLAQHAEHERRVLARLEHPNIARLIDGGSSEDGQPYLAMEYVEGTTLLVYAAQQSLDLASRVRLFIDVCAAVHYAHQQLVIHRDLKPSNIMVGADGRPRLLDFGIAKLLDPDAGTSTPTRSAPWLTPSYASPEQVRGGSLSTLSDVYALGVVLYEFLAGVRPYDLEGRTPSECERLICDVEPPRPSEAAPDPLLRQRLRGDLDVITLKALAKEPGRRYGSAEQLAEDLRRFLDQRPVLARPDSVAYRVRTFIRRNRTVAGLSALAIVLAVVGVVMVGWQAAVARRERDRSEFSRRQSEEVSNYLISLFDATDSIGPLLDTTVTRALLRQGITQAEALAGQPLLQARMFDALGMVLVRLHEYQRAWDLVERARALRARHLAPDHPDIAESYAHVGHLLRVQSKYEESLAMYQQALDIRVKAYGRWHPDVAEATRALAFLMPYLGRDAEAARLYEEALVIDRRVLGDAHPQTAEDLGQLGRTLSNLGEPERGLTMLEEALRTKARVFGPDDPATTLARFRVADQLRMVRNSARAESVYREALARHARAHGEMDPLLVHGLGNLADVLGERGRHAEAESLLRRAAGIRSARFGERSIAYVEVTDALAEAVARQGRFAEALALRQQGLAIWRAAFGPTHVAIAGSLGHVSEILQGMGRLQEAEDAARQAIAIRRQLLGDRQTLVGLSMLRLADVLVARKRLQAAESVATKALDIIAATRPEGHPDTRAAHRVMAGVLTTLGRTAEAARHRELGGS